VVGGSLNKSKYLYSGLYTDLIFFIVKDISLVGFSDENIKTCLHVNHEISKYTELSISSCLEKET
jgi:hypothetical protein